MKKSGLLILGVFLLLIASGLLIAIPLGTFLLSEVYAAKAQIMVNDPSQSAVATEVARIQSVPVLHKTIENMNLTREWGMRAKAPNGTLSLQQAEQRLRSDLEVEPLPGSAVIAITAYSESREEAPRIANEIASVYLRTGGRPAARILSPAQAQQKPARPNKAVAITLAVVAAFAFGAVGAVFIIVALRNRAIQSI